MNSVMQARKLLSSGIALALLLVPLASMPLVAAEPPPNVETIDMSEEVGRYVNSVIDMINGQKFDEAEVVVKDLQANFDKMTAYEKRVVMQISADLHMRMVKYPEAIADYEALLKLEDLSDSERLTAADTAGQLYLQVQDWNKGLEHLLTVNTLQNGRNMETLFRIAFAYSQLGQASAAVPYMEQALAAGGAQAPENYYRNMAVLYMQAKESAKAITTYEKFLEAYPNIADREQVSANVAALYIEVGNNAKARTLLQALLREFPSSAQAATYRQSLSAIGG